MLRNPGPWHWHLSYRRHVVCKIVNHLLTTATMLGLFGGARMWRINISVWFPAFWTRDNMHLHMMLYCAVDLPDWKCSRIGAAVSVQLDLLKFLGTGCLSPWQAFVTGGRYYCRHMNRRIIRFSFQPYGLVGSLWLLLLRAIPSECVHALGVDQPGDSFHFKN